MMPTAQEVGPSPEWVAQQVAICYMNGGYA